MLGFIIAHRCLSSPAWRKTLCSMSVFCEVAEPKPQIILNVKQIIMRYEKFLSKDYTTVRPATDLNESDGLRIVANNISELEQCENRNQCKILSVLYHTLTEIFEIDNLEMQTTNKANSFVLINKDDSEIKYGVNSPWLSREKLKNASPMELSGAIIDLILHRDKWTNEVSYKECHLFD